MLRARPLIIGIGGAIRPNSSSEYALKTSLRAAEHAGAETVPISGRELLCRCTNPSAIVQRRWCGWSKPPSDERVYFDGRAVGCIACAGGW
jgi:FMN reductase